MTNIDKPKPTTEEQVLEFAGKLIDSINSGLKKNTGRGLTKREQMIAAGMAGPIASLMVQLQLQKDRLVDLNRRAQKKLPPAYLRSGDM